MIGKALIFRSLGGVTSLLTTPEIKTAKTQNKALHATKNTYPMLTHYFLKKTLQIELYGI